MEGAEEVGPGAEDAGIKDERGEGPGFASGMGSNFKSTETSSTDWGGCTRIFGGASMRANRIKKPA